MKYNSYYFYIIISVCFLFTSCADEVNIDSKWSPSKSPRQLSLSAYDVKIPADGGKHNINVKANNTQWNFEGTDASWLSLTPKSGNSDAIIALITQPNLDPTTGRSVAYSFVCTDKDWQFSRQLSISQEAPGYYVRTTETNFTKSASDQQFTVNIEANSMWTAQSDQAWVSLSPNGSNVLTIHLSENTSSLTNDRIAYITIACGNATKVLTVNQQPPNIIIAADEIVYDCDEGTKSIEVKSDVNWSASCSQPWITLSPSEGNAGTSSLVLKATKNVSINERTANVYINVERQQLYSVPIKQTGMYINSDVSSLSAFPYQGGSQSIKIVSNTDWDIIYSPDFVTVSPITGSKGETDVTITTSLNNTEYHHSGDLILGKADITGLQTYVHIEQECANIGISEQTITVASIAGSSHNLSLTANQGWSASFQTGTWAHISPNSGDGTSTILLIADNNPSINQRQDILTITPTVTKTPLTFKFIQKGKSLDVSTTSLSINPKGGSAEPLIITTDGTYSITKSGDWFSISPNGNAITVTAQENTTKTVLNGTITISLTNLPSGESLSRTIKVQQNFPDNIDIEGFGDDQDWNFN